MGGEIFFPPQNFLPKKERCPPLLKKGLFWRRPKRGSTANPVLTPRVFSPRRYILKPLFLQKSAKTPPEEKNVPPFFPETKNCGRGEELLWPQKKPLLCNNPPPSFRERHHSLLRKTPFFLNPPIISFLGKKKKRVSLLHPLLGAPFVKQPRVYPPKNLGKLTPQALFPFGAQPPKFFSKKPPFSKVGTPPFLLRPLL